MAARPAWRRPASSSSWARTASQPMPRSVSTAACEGDGPDDVGRPGLLAVGWRRPDHLVQVDEVDGAAAGQERVAGLEEGTGSDQGTAAEGRVELVAAEGQVVGLGGQRPVRRELGRVDQDRHAPLVGGVDDLVEGWQPPGHVGGAGDRQQRRPAAAGVERGHHVVDGEGPVGPALDVAALRHPAPGQQVGVVLDHGGDHHVGRVEPQPVGEMVDGLGGVAAQDGDVGPVLVPAGEGQDGRGAPPRRRRSPGATGSPPPGARSSTRGGTPTPARRPPGGPGSRRPGRARRRAARCRRGRAPAARRRPAGPGAAPGSCRAWSTRPPYEMAPRAGVRSRACRPSGPPGPTTARDPDAGPVVARGAGHGRRRRRRGRDDDGDRRDRRTSRPPARRPSPRTEQHRTAVDAVDRLLDEVERALARLDDGTYGRCEACGEPIADDRLAEHPIVPTCARCDEVDGGRGAAADGPAVPTPRRTCSPPGRRPAIGSRAGTERFSGISEFAREL